MKAADILSKFSMEGVAIKSYCSASDDELLMVLDWRNDPEIRKFMFTTDEIKVSEHLEYARGLEGREDRFYFIVIREGTYIGSIAVTEADYRNKSTFLGIYARPDEAIKGAGQTLMHAICKIVFDAMEFHSLRLEVLESNERAIRFYEKFGFKTDGVLREVYSKQGIYENVLIMSMLEREYRGRYE